MKDPLKKYSWRVFGAIKAAEAAGELTPFEWLHLAELVHLIALYRCLRKVVPDPGGGVE